MRRRLSAIGLSSIGWAVLCSIATAASGADLNPSIAPAGTTVAPPAGHPHAYTAAPVPTVGPPGVSPTNRFGNADDAGPINSTPLSSNLSPSIGVGPNANAVRQTDPTADTVPSDGGHD